MRELDNVIICKSSNLQKVLLFDTKFENLVEIKSSIFKEDLGGLLRHVSNFF